MTSESERLPTDSNSGVLDREFSGLVPAFFGVLHNLVLRGLPIDLGDGMDHVHDFYLEAWPGVRARFDPEKGNLRTYAISSFYQFARKRAVQAAVFRRALEGVNWAELDADRVSVESSSDRNRVLTAFADLASDERAVLTASFGIQHDLGRASERAIARQLGLTVHRFREIRSRALAALAVRLGERGVLTDLEFRVARSLFVEALGISATAEMLGLTENQVRHTRQTLLSKFGSSFRSLP